MELPGAALTGTHRVRIFRPAFDQVRKLCRSTRECIELRRHALQLRYWPGHQTDEGGQLVDLNWTWVKSLPGLQIGELRIDDVIGGNDNLRIIFFVGDEEVKQPLPMIWVLNVFQKKRDYLTTSQVKVFRGQRQLVIERFYQSRL